MKNVNSSNFDEIINSSGLVLVEFSADWCGPCKRQTPILEQFSKDNPEVKVLTVDTDESPELASEYNIKSVPTLILFKDGTKVEVKVGLTTLGSLNTLVKQF